MNRCEDLLVSGAAVSTESPWPRFSKLTMVDGSPRRVECLTLAGQTFVVDGGIVSTMRLEEEWYEDLRDPVEAVRLLSASNAPPADLFTFWQRVPDVEPRFPFRTEWEELAVLRIQSYEHWWTKQLKPQARNKARKAEKAGVIVKEVGFDDEFVKGMTAIFNESPVRQGRLFWHYGKSVETVKEQFSRCIFRERMIGAYFQGQMIGFVMLANAGRFAIPGQIIASIHHRDKGTSNALLAKAVELCVQQGLDRLVYMYWGDDSLADFKRSCGFEPVRVPRYWIPLTQRGKLALAIGLHRGWKAMIPDGIRSRLKEVLGPTDF